MKYVIIIVFWGGLIYFLLYGLPNFNLDADFGSGNRYFASVIESFNNVSLVDDNSVSAIENIISISYDGNSFNSSKVYAGNVDIFDIAFAPGDLSKIYAGSNKGLLISQDGGLSWHQISDLENKISQGSKIYKIIFISSKEVFISVYQDGKGIIYRSSNNFLNLEKVYEVNGEVIYYFDIINNNLYAGLSNGKLMSIYLPTDEVKVLYQASSGILNLETKSNSLFYILLSNGTFAISYDGGKSFVKKATTPKDFVVSGSVIYLATDSGLARSSNGGNSWEIIKTLPSEEISVSAVGIINGEIYVASDNELFKSRDNGLSWKIIDSMTGRRDISIIASDRGRIVIGTK